MIVDRQLSLSASMGCVIAWTLWALAALTLILTLVANAHELTIVTNFLAIAAGTATIRTYFVHHNRTVRAYANMLLKDLPDRPQPAPTLHPVR